MNIAPIAATSANDVNQNENPAAPAIDDSLANKEAFLQLLVAQLKNQDPLNPADGTEFLSQLAQFSELEQLMGIRTEIKGLRNDAAQEVPESDSTAQV
jgi:flagellar basal-body rod modification protein FlgD